MVETQLETFKCFDSARVSNEEAQRNCFSVSPADVTAADVILIENDASQQLGGQQQVENSFSSAGSTPAASGILLENASQQSGFDTAVESSFESTCGNHHVATPPDTINNSEMARVLSFPDNTTLSFRTARALAKSGLYYAEAGGVRCSFCELRVPVARFSDPDSVEAEHKKLSPGCLLMRGQDVGNIPLPDDVTNHRYETNRILNFLAAGWSKIATTSHPVGALDLARWGFYATGSGDAARCAFCRLEVRGWEQGDTAEAEHRRWNPQCAFLQGRSVCNFKLGEEPLEGNVVHDCAERPQNVILQAASISFGNASQQPGIEEMACNEGVGSSLETLTSVNDAVVTEANSDYNLEIWRLLSFPDNTLSLRVARQLAKSGVYHDGAGGARCSFCALSVAACLSEADAEALAGAHVDCCHAPRSSNVPLTYDYTNFRYEANRVLNFLKASWPRMPDASHPVGALDLARWGFYATGSGDAARCAFCRLEVRGWEQGDTAEAEHRRWNPQCAFLQGRSVGNVKLGEEPLEGDVVPDLTHGAVRHNVMHQGLPVENFRDKESLGVFARSAPKHIEYATLASRTNSYAMWPLSLKQRPEQLSEAGFYYTGKGDRVICYQCGGGLKDWGATDTPWVEHAVWFPSCAHLLMKKGQEFVKQVLLLKESLSKKASSPESVPCFKEESKAQEPMETDNKEEFPKKDKKDKPAAEVPNSMLCKVCLDRELGIVFLPCGHMAACTDCAPQLSACPICRAKTTAYVRAFLT